VCGAWAYTLHTHKVKFTEGSPEQALEQRVEREALNLLFFCVFAAFPNDGIMTI